MNTSSKILDLIIFGASGMTGQYVVEALAEYSLQPSCKRIRFGVAGNDEKELKVALQNVSMLTGYSMDNVVIIVADAMNPESLSNMASKCRVVISCVGPFRFFGEAVLRACLAHGTHYIGAGGEGQYLMRTHLTLHKEAEEQGIYIVDACGAASILADCGAVFLQQNFDGFLNDVEIVTDVCPFNTETRRFSYASLLSYTNILSHTKEWGILEKDYLSGYPTNWFYHVQPKVLRYNKNVGCWCTPNPQCDTIVGKKSQIFLKESQNTRPFQIHHYAKSPNLLTAILEIVWFTFISIMSNFVATKWLIEKFPSFFTLGMCNPRNPPERKSLASTQCTVHLFGSGWSGDDAPLLGQLRKPDRVVKVEVTCQNPFYGATGKMLLEAAWTVLFESQKMPERGGVYTPAFAFKDTTLINRLCQQGIYFEIKK